MAELRTRKLYINQEAWFETSKSINLDGEKNIPKYASQYTSKTAVWENKVNNLLMRGNDIMLYNAKAFNKLSIYINANNGILDVKEITNYVKKADLRTFEIYKYSLEELNKVKKQYKNSSGWFDNGKGGTDRKLFEMMYNIAGKIKLSKFEQQLLDYAETCRDKIFSRGFNSSAVKYVLPTEVNGNLITVASLVQIFRRDKKVMAAQVGTGLAGILMSGSKNSSMQILGNELKNFDTEPLAQLADEWFIVPEFTVKVDRNDVKIKNYNASLVNSDLKLLKGLITNFNNYVNNIYRNYLDSYSRLQGKGSIFSFLSENENMVSFNALVTLNRECLGKVDQYASTIENLIEFYSSIL